MDSRPAFWQAVAAALLGHAAALAWLAGQGPGPAPQGALRGTSVSFLVRPVVVAPPAPVDPVATGAESPDRPEPRETAQRAERPEPAPSPPVVPIPAVPPLQEPRTETSADAPYLPRGQLTVPPRPLGPVDVPFPADVAGVVDLKVRVTLFIDEQGTVQRVRLDSPDVHPSFERSIRESFGAAKFSPGELDQVAVRSQIRLEVEFQAPGARPTLGTSQRG